MKSTFSQLLNEYFFGGSIPVRYWQRYKDRLWLHHGLKPWPGLRERVLEKERKRSARRQKEYFKDLVHAPLFSKLIEKDDTWTGGNLIVPFRMRAEDE